MRPSTQASPQGLPKPHSPLAEKGAPQEAAQPPRNPLGPVEGRAQREGPGLTGERPPLASEGPRPGREGGAGSGLPPRAPDRG